LFITNIPPFIEKDELAAVLGRVGPIEAISADPVLRGVVRVVFMAQASVERGVDELQGIEVAAVTGGGAADGGRYLIAVGRGWEMHPSTPTLPPTHPAAPGSVALALPPLPTWSIPTQVDERARKREQLLALMAGDESDSD